MSGCSVVGTLTCMKVEPIATAAPGIPSDSQFFGIIYNPLENLMTVIIGTLFTKIHTYIYTKQLCVISVSLKPTHESLGSMDPCVIPNCLIQNGLPGKFPHELQAETARQGTDSTMDSGTQTELGLRKCYSSKGQLGSFQPGSQDSASSTFP